VVVTQHFLLLQLLAVELAEVGRGHQNQALMVDQAVVADMDIQVQEEQEIHLQ
jgi:hypothetical protein